MPPTLQQKFTMPEVKVGDIVLFYVGADRSQAPNAAFISGVGNRSVVLNMVDQNTYNFLIRDGVRHMDDPDLEHNTETRAMGGWDYTDSHKMLLEHQKQIQYLMSQDVPDTPDLRSKRGRAEAAAAAK